MTLRDLVLLLTTAGSGGAVFLLMDNIAYLKNLPPDVKRYASLLLSVLVPVAAWLLGVAMAYFTPPDTWRGWVEAVFAVGAGGVLTSQTLHGALRLSQGK